MGKGKYSGERECESHIEELLCYAPIPREEVHIAADRGVRLQYLDRILIRIAYVEHERLIEPIGKVDLFDKRFRLHVFRAFVDAIVVEPAFTDRDDLRILPQRFVCSGIEYLATGCELLPTLSELLSIVVRLGRMHRMQAYRGIDTLMLLSQRYC